MFETARNLSWRDAVFSLKTFAAAALALFVAFRIDLPQPSWALTTVYVVAQPLAGMVIAKSIYRVIGTVVGAVVSLLLVALFSNSPELFCSALALWIGACTALSIYLRDAPQAYAGVLSGYSAAIIGLPAALAPETAFDFAVARCLEIILGIACGTLIHHVVFPQRAGDALIKALSATLPSMADWIENALRGSGDDAKRLADRRRMIADVVSLDLLRVFGGFDSARIRRMAGVIRQFEGKLLSLLALLVSIGDRFAALARSRPDIAARLRPMLQKASRHVAETADLPTLAQSPQESAAAAALRAEIDAMLPPQSALRDDAEVFPIRSILLRLRDVVELWHQAVWIRTHIEAGIHPPAAESVPAFRPYRDLPFALTGGAISAVTVLGASAFWIASGWVEGATAVTFAGIMCAIMGARDDPAAAARQFLQMTLVGAAIAAGYVLLVLPAQQSFGELLLVLAPFYLLCGLFLNSPRTVPATLPVIFAAGGLIGISRTMTYDFAAFLNTVAGYVVGIAIGVAALGLLRPLGAELAVQRLTRGILRDLAAAAGGRLRTRAAFESRSFERINAVLARLDPMLAEQRATMQGALASLRVGLNMLVLRAARDDASSDAATSAARALDALRNHFAAAARGRSTASPLPLLAALRASALSADNDAQLQLAEALYAIETTMQMHAAFFSVADQSAQPRLSEQTVTA